MRNRGKTDQLALQFRRNPTKFALKDPAECDELADDTREGKQHTDGNGTQGRTSGEKRRGWEGGANPERGSTPTIS